MQLVASIARASGARRVLDLGCGLGYSTLWLASAVADGGSVLGVDDDPTHIAEARAIATDAGVAASVAYETGRVADVLAALTGTFDLVHDDAWFARAPDHLDVMVERLRPGGVLTMANWFLLVDALTGRPRNDWVRFSGAAWAADTLAYAEALAARPDLAVTWVTSPPIGFATKLR